MWLSLVMLPSSSAWTAAHESLFFSSHELKESHPEIHRVVTSWEKSGTRMTLPIGKGEVLKGFVLEYGNSGFIDYHLTVGVEAKNGIRAFMNNEEVLPSSEQKQKLSKIFERIGRYKRTGGGRKNINPFVVDGNVYLLTLMDQGKVVKIPFYSPDLDDKKPSAEVSLLSDILDFDVAIRAKTKK